MEQWPGVWVIGVISDRYDVTTVVRPWFGRGTSHLARQCDCAGRGSEDPEEPPLFGSG